ncbi:MAG: cation diffusion facilitator family transporter, partial [Thermomicrobiales bacterium]
MTGRDQATHDHAHDEPEHLHPDQVHDHDHYDHDHAHGEHTHDDYGHDHGAHDHDQGRFGWLSDWLPFGHGHSHGETAVDSALESSERGLQALRISLLGLGVTAVIQLVIAIASGSVGLLADTIHNFADALTAVPLWIAFV